MGIRLPIGGLYFSGEDLRRTTMFMGWVI